MSQVIATLVLGVGLISAPNLNAQELPEFDDEDFQVLSIVDDSYILASSNGRDFLCYVRRNSVASYIETGFCLPYVSRSEARNADKALADAKAAALVAEAEAKAAADAAAELRWKEKNRLLAESAKSAIKNPTGEVANLLTELDPIKLRPLIISLARASRLTECRLKVHAGKYLYDGTVSMIVKSLSLRQSVEGALLLQIVRERTSEVLEAMIADGSLVRADDLTYIGLKECQ